MEQGSSEVDINSIESVDKPDIGFVAMPSIFFLLFFVIACLFASHEGEHEEEKVEETMLKYM